MMFDGSVTVSADGQDEWMKGEGAAMHGNRATNRAGSETASRREMT